MTWAPRTRTVQKLDVVEIIDRRCFVEDVMILHASRFGSLSISIDHSGGLDEPAPAACDCLLGGRKPGSSIADRPSSDAIHRRSTASIGGQSQDSGNEMAVSNRDHRHTRNLAGMAPEIDRPKYDGSGNRKPGRPRILAEVQALIVRMARENREWAIDVSRVPSQISDTITPTVQSQTS